MRHIVVLLTLLASIVGLIHSATNRTVAAQPAIQSGIKGYCLDAQSDTASSASVVDTKECDNSLSQAWSPDLTSIKGSNNTCLSVLNDLTTAGSKIVAKKCSNAPGQVWLRDKNGFINPNSQLCLSLPGNKTGTQLVIASCDLLNRASEQWHAVTPGTKSPALTCPSTEGERVACYAIQEWTNWQADPANRTTLLEQYTDNASYEEWCADFISYIYKEAGYPFVAGVDGWDINGANDIQNQGFTQHDPSSYTPKPGDVAYFNYDGGHVEIVVVGGKHPTFVYGNSGDVDPVTGNGTMKANTITDDGDNGRLVYYLSPNRV